MSLLSIALAVALVTGQCLGSPYPHHHEQQHLGQQSGHGISGGHREHSSGHYDSDSEYQHSSHGGGSGYIGSNVGLSGNQGYGSSLHGQGLGGHGQGLGGHGQGLGGHGSTLGGQGLGGSYGSGSHNQQHHSGSAGASNSDLQVSSGYSNKHVEVIGSGQQSGHQQQSGGFGSGQNFGGLHGSGGGLHGGSSGLLGTGSGFTNGGNSQFGAQQSSGSSGLVIEESSGYHTVNKNQDNFHNNNHGSSSSSSGSHGHGSRY